MTYNFVENTANDKIQPLQAIIDDDGSIKFTAPNLGSSNFDGFIPVNTASAYVNNVNAGDYFSPSGSSTFYQVVSVEREDPSLTQTGSVYSGYQDIYYVDDNGELISASFSSSAAVVYLKNEEWESEERFLGNNGWIITSGGNAIFTNVAVRGRIEAKEGYIGGTDAGWEITDSLFSNASVGFYAPSATTGQVAIFAGAPFASRASAAFRVGYDGSMVASSANITGALTATTMNVGGSAGITYNGSNVTIGTGVTILGTTTTDSLLVGASPNLLRISASPNGVVGEDGIFISSANYWYSTGKFSLGGEQGITFNSGSVVIGTDVYVNAGVTVNALTVGTAPSLLKISASPAGLAGNDGIYIDPYNFWYSDGRFSVGGSANSACWNGNALSVKGNINATSGSFSGDITASAGRFVGALSVSSSGAIYAGTDVDSGQRTVLNASGLFGYHSSGVEAFALPVSGSPRLGTFTIIPTGIVSQSASYANMIYGNVDASGSVTDGIVIRGSRSLNASAAIYTVQNGVETSYATGNGFYVDENARFKLKGATGSLSFDGTDLYVSGNINANSGFIGGTDGWVINSNIMYNDDPSDASLYVGIYAPSDGTLDNRISTNPSFESPSTAGYSSTQTLTTSTDYAYRGSYSAKIVISSYTDSKILKLINPISTAVGTYTYSAYAYVAAGSGLIGKSFSITATGGSGYTTSNSSSVTLTSGQWVRASLTVTYSGGFTAPDINAEIAGMASNGDSVYLDAVMCNSGTTAELYFDDTYSGAVFGSSIDGSVLLMPETAFYSGASNRFNAPLMIKYDGSVYSGASDTTKAPFIITKTGYLTATGASISGNITAPQGSIGGFVLSASSLTASPASGSVVGFTTGASAIFVGATSLTGAGARFWVSNNGILYASAAIIAGDSIINGTNIGNGGGNISANLRIGSNALVDNTTGTGNTALGDNALTDNTIGSNNVAIGNGAANLITVGNGNIAIGRSALGNLNSANSWESSYNVAIGDVAGGSTVSGSGNVFINYAGTVSDFNTFYLGVGGNNATSLAIKIDSSLNTFLYGNLSVNNNAFYVDKNGKVGINQLSPASALHVVGGLYATGDANISGAASANSSLYVGTTASVVSNLAVGGTFRSVGAASALSSLYVGGAASAVSSLYVGSTASIVSILYANNIYTSNNGNGTNFRVGDDAWIGDINVADTISIRGVSGAVTNGFIRFGSDTNSFGYNGTILSYNGSIKLGGAASATSSFYVGTTGSVVSDLAVGGTFRSVGAASALSTLYIGGAASAISSLYVGTTSSFVGNSNFGGTVIVGGNATFNSNVTLGTSSAATEVRSQAIFDTLTANVATVQIAGAGNNYRLQRSTASSRKWKHDIKDMPSILQDVLNLRPVTFKYNLDYLPSTDNRSGLDVYGLIAEEVADVIPLAADYDEGQPSDWNYRILVPILIKAIQEQQKQIEELSDRINSLGDNDG